MKKIENVTLLNILASALIIFTAAIVFWFLAKNNIFTNFIQDAENKSFDYRQRLLSERKDTFLNKNNISIVTIDDVSFEYLWDKYGEWPVPRNVYSELINQIEKTNPKAIVFDLLFIKSLKSSNQADQELINTVNKYNNIYTAMNFDNIPSDARTPIELPGNLQVKVENQSSITNLTEKMTFTNCRPILSGLLNGKAHVGIANVNRSTDGIIRTVSPFAYYKENYYPYLSLLAGDIYLNKGQTKVYTINQKSELLIGDKKIPLTQNGEAILNWYGGAGKVFDMVPMYKLLLNAKNNMSEYNFKNKVVFVGTTATSLHDTKSVPVSRLYPGVEIHATFLNNLIDNNFIAKTNVFTDVLIMFIIALITICVVFASSSAIFATLSTIMLVVGYTLVTYYCMAIANLWVPLVLPILIVIITFALSYIIKYIIKSKDFEYQYKLATVDGLTDLYNHRYFQENLIQQIETAKRYGTNVSLIIVDIDFFKKFNDTYGHQAGDAVLRQVAQTLKKNVRTSDVVCRYGGEEMSIILPNTNNKEARANAERICKAVAERVFKLNATVECHVTISLGVATYPQGGELPKDLIETADKGLYRAKENGRNQVGSAE